MSPSSSHCFVIALLVGLTTLSVPQVDAYYTYYYYYYYYTTPRTCPSRFYGSVTTCPISSCYTAQTYNSCCLNIFLHKGVYYQQCVCNAGTCAPTPSYDASTPSTTSSTSTTTSATTTTTPTTTTSAITTTPTTTTTTTTTPAFRSLCSTTFRPLNGEAAEQCEFTGVAKITMMNGTIAACNAVYAPATVNGKTNLTLVTAGICKNITEEFSKMDATLDIEIGKHNYPVPSRMFQLVDGPDGIAFIVINDRYVNSFSGLGCQAGACPLNKATMEGKVDFTDCKIASWSASDAATLTQSGLYEAKLKLNAGGCSGIPDEFGAANTLCFKTVNGANLVCSGDSGAPVYCKAPSNGEDILVGVSALETQCNGTSEVKVLQYPG